MGLLHLRNCRFIENAQVVVAADKSKKRLGDARARADQETFQTTNSCSKKRDRSRADGESPLNTLGDGFEIVWTVFREFFKRSEHREPRKTRSIAPGATLRKRSQFFLAKMSK